MPYVCHALPYRCSTYLFEQIARATNAVSTTIDKTTEPIRNTAAYKTLAETLVDALDDSGSAKHAGFEEKEARRLRRQKRLAKAGKERGIGRGRVKEDPESVICISYPIFHLIPFIELANLLFYIRIRHDKRLGTVSKNPTLCSVPLSRCARLTMSRNIPSFRQYGL